MPGSGLVFRDGVASILVWELWAGREEGVVFIDSLRWWDGKGRDWYRARWEGRWNGECKAQKKGGRRLCYTV